MLDSDIKKAFEDNTKDIGGLFYVVNLSRGLLNLDHIPGSHFPVSITRIQSTSCEQKRWPHILETLPPDFYLQLAVGRTGFFHDVSERPRLTRATWQGLSWIRFAINTAWGLGWPTRERGLRVPDEFSRRGVNVTGYWDHVYRNLPRSTKSVLNYYKGYRYDSTNPVALHPCRQCIPKEGL